MIADLTVVVARMPLWEQIAWSAVILSALVVVVGVGWSILALSTIADIEMPAPPEPERPARHVPPVRPRKVRDRQSYQDAGADARRKRLRQIQQGQIAGFISEAEPWGIDRKLLS